MRVVVVIAVLCCAVGCGGGDDEPTAEGLTHGLERAREGLRNANLQRLEMAVQMLEASLGSIQDGGGYRSWTASDAARTLVETQTSANQPLPGERTAPGPEITFVLGPAPGVPWRIVLIPNDAARSIKVEAYADDPSKPHLERTMAVSQY